MLCKQRVGLRAARGSMLCKQRVGLGAARNRCLSHCSIEFAEFGVCDESCHLRAYIKCSVNFVQVIG